MGSSSKASFRSAQASSSGARRQGLGRGDQSPSMMPPNGRAQTHTPGRGSPRSENRDGLLPAVALRRLCSHCGADIPNFQTRQDPVTASVSPAQDTGRSWELTALINSPKRKASPLPPRNPGFLEGRKVF
ncbi:p53-regulated apoptosis-inducing protein 1 isoform X1 [Piliocolobus tephrosceles]|uniref:p53-regulated apoptosis-inducing protein 1 isoform X1 n=1 Tax=Piliocolobus tephrosceles TaxID=591936 RepID=UPI000E6B18FC|nr:p53-regulated apoptosis-inducing protein 1 isoform X1 [Piliocolobus tephrosceles]